MYAVLSVPKPSSPILYTKAGRNVYLDEPWIIYLYMAPQKKKKVMRPKRDQRQKIVTL